MRIPNSPRIYQINTATFISRLQDIYGDDTDLSCIPAEEYDRIAGFDVDVVWFMGVWERSRIGMQMARKNREYVHAFEGSTEEDVIGSAYSIKSYTVDARFGGNEGLAQARQELAQRGIAMMLDYVPNHVGPDHDWVVSHPEYFILGEESEAENEEAFFATHNAVIARGKDPQYAPWRDTLQLNAFSPALRLAVEEELTKIAQHCDGVRCDMAMLMLSDVFAETWGERAGGRPKTEFWKDVIEVGHGLRGDFFMMAEAYWDMQPQLLELGFDACYDKDFYDEMRKGDAQTLRAHLHKVKPYENQLVRFLENHDEPRMLSLVSPARTKLAAVLLAALPSGKLYLDGQFEGARYLPPVQIARTLHEEVDENIAHFYAELRGALQSLQSSECAWRELELSDEDGPILSLEIRCDTGALLLMVNFSDQPVDVDVSFDPEQILFSSKQTESTPIQLEPWGWIVVDDGA